MKDKQETRVKKAHISLMKHPETTLYSGVMLMGNTEIADGKFTAYTDGVNKKYCRQFLEGIKEEAKLRGLVLHENLHVGLKHMPRGKDMWKEDKKLANIAADIAVHDVIVNIKGTVSGSSEPIVLMPDGGIYDEAFHNWSMREIYNELRKQNPQRQKPKNGTPDSGKGGNGQGSGSGEGEPEDGDGDIININGRKINVKDSELDEHDLVNVDDLTHDEQKELSDKIDKALREGGILAGRIGGKMPRSISDLLEPKIDWREELSQFVTSAMKGAEEMTWRKPNRRQMANDIYLPSVESETIGEIVVAIDTSGSIGSAQITEFATELSAICNMCSPEQVRVLWWDTEVHGEQLFSGTDYDNIAGLLKPLGGGGTHVSCVSDYIVKQGIEAECVLVFTDGYVENDVDWKISAPTLWLVTQYKSFNPPSGNKVMFD